MPISDVLIRLPATLAIALAVASPIAAATGDVTDFGVVPSDAGVFNVRSYGAVGDGVHDDTAAIRAALEDAWRVGWRNEVVYFPNGTYLVSAPIRYRDAKGGWHGYTTLQGQSQAGTVIRLKDATFTTVGAGADPALRPGTATCIDQTVIWTGSEYNGTGEGDGGDAFNDFVEDLTVDTGRGNPGAIGIHMNASNCGGLRDVTIRSGDGQGIAGLDLRIWYPGPAYGANVTISGFRYGILANAGQTDWTFSHLTLQGQSVAGIVNRDLTLAIEDLRSSDAVPVILNSGIGYVTVVGGDFAGGGGGAAIRSTDTARIYARAIATHGYATVATENGAAVAADAAGEYVTPGIYSVFPSPQHSLGLPIVDTPRFIDRDPAHWLSAAAYATMDQYRVVADGSGALQRAIDDAAARGATTIYLPRGTYRLDRTVVVHAPVRRIIGFGAMLDQGAATGLSPFLVRADAAAVSFERLNGTDYIGPILGASAQDIVMIDTLRLPYRSNGGTGRVFAEDISPLRFEIDHQTAYARQLDPETDNTHVANRGGTVWILGLKTEGFGTIIDNEGGTLELLGSWSSMQTAKFWDGTPYPPEFINHEGSVSLVFTNDNPWGNEVLETRGGATRTLSWSAYGKRSDWDAAGLYVGYVGATDTHAPSTPAGLTATAGGPDRVVLAWSPASDDVGVAGYRIVRDGAVVATTTAATWTDSGLAAATTYAYAIVAFDAAGNASPPSATVAATTARAVVAGANLLADPGFELQTTAAIAGAWRAEGPATSGIDATPAGPPHGGSRDAYLYATGPIGFSAIAQTVAVTPGARYRLSAWVDNSAGALSGVVLGARRPAGAVLAQTTVPATATYVQVAVDVAAGTADHVVVYEGYFSGSGFTWIHLDDVALVRIDASAPHGGAAAAVPGILQAADFDDGGEGIAYHDADPGNDGGGYRAGGVDIRACIDPGSAWQVGWFGVGEWLAYSVDVASAGDYDLAVRVACGSSGGSVHVEVDGVDATGSLPFGSTGGYDAFVELVKRGVPLAAGPHVLRLVCDAGNLDCDRIVVGVPSALVDGGWYHLRAKHSGELLAVAGSSTVAGANVWTWATDGTTGEDWRLIAVGDGSWELIARCSGDALDMRGWSTANGGDASQWPLHGGANQRWLLQDTGGGWYRIVNVNSGKALDCSGAGTADGTDVIQWDDHAGDNQRWAIEPIDPRSAG